MRAMKHFYFKLQPLLNKEHIYESECIERLRNIQGAFSNEKNKSENIRKRMMICQCELKSKKELGVFSEELITYENYFLKLNSDMNASDLKLQEIAKELRIVQDELWKIIKKKKALEKLRDKWEEEYRNYLAYLSNKEMDDIAMTKFTNKLVVEND